MPSFKWFTANDCTKKCSNTSSKGVEEGDAKNLWGKNWNNHICWTWRIHTMPFGAKHCVPSPENYTGNLWTALPCNPNVTLTNWVLMFAVMDYITQASFKSLLIDFHTVQNSVETKAVWNRAERLQTGKKLRKQKQEEQVTKVFVLGVKPLFTVNALSTHQPDWKNNSINLLICIAKEIVHWM